MTYRQQNSKAPGEWRFGRRGTAMVEFVLVLPLLLTVLAATFFFGWAMMHKHQVSVADRYAAWRRVETGGWPSEDRINEVCFADRAKDVDLVSEAAVRQTARDLVDVAGQQGAPVELLAEELVVERYPGGKRARVSATFGHAMADLGKVRRRDHPPPRQRGRHLAPGRGLLLGDPAGPVLLRTGRRVAEGSGTGERDGLNGPRAVSGPVVGRCGACQAIGRGVRGEARRGSARQCGWPAACVP